MIFCLNTHLFKTRIKIYMHRWEVEPVLSIHVQWSWFFRPWNLLVGLHFIPFLGGIEARIENQYLVSRISFQQLSKATYWFGMVQ